MRGGRPIVVEIAVLTVIYVAAARLGFMLGAVSGFAALVWAPSGIALAALWLRLRRWPAIVLGGVIVNVMVGAPLALAATFALGNTLEAVVAVYVLRGLGFRRDLDRLRDVVALTLVAAGTAGLSATIGASSLWAFDRIASGFFTQTWVAWWWGNFAADLLIAPVLLTWRAGRVGDARRRLEAATLALALILVATMVFYGQSALAERRFMWPHSLYPLLIWAAIRFGPRGAALACFLVGAEAVAAVLLAVGPFLDEGFLAVQSFVAISAVTTLCLGAISAERTTAQRALQRSNDALEERVRARVTELEEMNVAIARRQQQLEEAQALASIGSYEYDLANGQLTWSDEMCRLHGLAPGTQIDPQRYLELLLPADREMVRTTIAPAQREGRPFTFEQRVVRPDGSIRLLRTHGRVEIGPAGKPVRIHGTCQDITERQQADEARSRLAAIVESTEDAVIGRAVDRPTIESWNRGAETIFGYTADEAVGQPTRLIVPPDRWEELERLHAMVLAGQRVMAFETKRRRKDGTVFDASVTISPILDGAGRRIGIASIARDITRQKQALREKEVLLQEIHHRVKNNLQVIVSLLDLQVPKSTTSEVRRAFEDSRSRVLSIALVHELLYESKDLAVIELAAYLRRLVARIVGAYGLANERIDVRARAGDVALDLDTAVPFGLIVNELVTNSLKHAFPDDRHGRVDVSIEPGAADTCVLVVADDGIGIAESVQLDTVGTLGLQIVGSLTRQLGGTAEIVRAGGTTFRITFPRQRLAA